MAFEQPDLLTLQRDEARQRHVDEEGRDDEEDRRQDAAHGAQLLQLRIEEGMRELVLPCIAAKPAIAVEQPVEGGDHIVRIAAPDELERHAS